MQDNPSPTIEPSAGSIDCQIKTTPRILVVEDDAEVRQLNADTLKRCGYEVDAAEDGAVGWDTLQANKYDLLITDNKMPKVTGLELVNKLRSAQMTLPVIMATGTLPAPEIVQSAWLKLTATLIKPYSIDELLGMVDGVLRLSKPERCT